MVPRRRQAKIRMVDRSAKARQWLTRGAWVITAAGAWATIAIAAWLRPDTRGFGTHQQLGLPPCGFEAVTHIPCPGCGLTTSFAHMAHGHLLEAFRAHLMGPLLFAIVVWLAFYAPYAATRGRPMHAVLDARPAFPVLMVTAFAGVLTFALRLAHVHY
jgi:hypothetical protein